MGPSGPTGPVGGTATVVATRPVSAAAGTLIFNTTSLALELYDGAAWQTFKKALPASCKEVLAQGGTADGVYTIQTAPGEAPVQVFCDQTRDQGGWTLLITLAPTTNTTLMDFAFLSRWPSTFSTSSGAPATTGLYHGSLAPFTEVREEVGSGCSVVYAKNLNRDALEVIRRAYGWQDRVTFAPMFAAMPICRLAYATATDDVASCASASATSNDTSVLGFQVDPSGTSHTWFARGNCCSTAGGSSKCGSDADGTAWAKAWFR